MSQRMRWILAGVPLALGLGGCAAPMHWRYDAPALSGLVLRDGVPVPGAVVRLSSRPQTQPRVVTTAADGRFETEPIRNRERMPAGGWDPAFGYTVEITVDGRTYPGFSEGGMGYAPTTLSLQCELSQPVKGREGLRRNARDEVRHCAVIARGPMV